MSEKSSISASSTVADGGGARERLTHYLFRYPAKFHPPIARSLIEKFSNPGQTIFDPFIGSGTSAVEALATGRNAVGVDVDPVAVAVATAKTQRLRPQALKASAELLLHRLGRYERDPREYEHRQFVDLSPANYLRQSRQVIGYIPHIPNIEHWFRRYVIIDLARIRRTLSELEAPLAHRQFLEIVFASIIRNASNADPVPVSGLEVTSHMIRKDAEGRVINPFMLFRKAIAKALVASKTFYEATTSKVHAKVFSGNAISLKRALRGINCIITSPPYHGAVDYYRRHTLEMYWLGKTASHDERLILLEKYIGRLSVPKRNLNPGLELSALAARWEKRIREVSDRRADSFRHYAISMKSAFNEIAKVLRAGSPAIFVVGNSRWNGTELPTHDLLEEAAEDHFDLMETFSYSVKNRYMSYSRHNGADIKVDHVLVFHRRRR